MYASTLFSVNKQKGLVQIPLILLLIIGLSLAAILFIKQNTDPNVQGVLIAKDDDSSSGSSGSGSSGSEDSSGSKSSDDKSDKLESKTITPEGVRVETKTKDEKQKTEIRFGEGEKIKTKIEEGRSRIDVYSGGVKVRYEIRDGRVTIKAETKSGENVPEQELFKITDRLDKTGIKVAAEGGKFLVARNQVGAIASFPLQIDLNTNQLIASTSAGTRILTVLPDQAVQNMLAANVISRLGPLFIRQAVQRGEATSAAQIIQLGLRAGVPVYEISGIRDFRLLGFIPVSAPVTAIVSAETGEVVTTEQSLLTRVVDLLSFHP